MKRTLTLMSALLALCGCATNTRMAGSEYSADQRAEIEIQRIKSASAVYRSDYDRLDGYLKGLESTGKAPLPRFGAQEPQGGGK